MNTGLNTGNQHCCNGCSDRSVDPLCRLTCERWKEHEEQKRKRYAETERRMRYMDRTANRKKGE